MSTVRRQALRAAPLVRLAAMSMSMSMATASVALAQSAPSARDVAGYGGLHAAAHQGDAVVVERLLARPDVELEARDGAGRTPLHVAAFASHDDIVRRLADAGADLDALEDRAYDVVTIAAVADDVELLDVALDLGAGAGNVTSPWDGTALIAAAHLVLLRHTF